MTRDELLKRKNQARQEREFHLQQAGIALGIEGECERLLEELPPMPTAGLELALPPASGTPPEKVTPLRKRAPDDPRS